MSDPQPDIFELVLARSASMPTGPSHVHVWWRAPEQGDRLIQIYVDSELADVTDDPMQRERWLLVGDDQPRVIELLAVEPGEDCWAPRPDLLKETPKRRATIALLRESRFPIDTVVAIVHEGVEIHRAALWPADVYRGGFGALFGLGDFGHDQLAGPGLGRGELGMGELGIDGTLWRWIGEPLSPGSHAFEVHTLDCHGKALAAPIPVSFEAQSLPSVPTHLSVQGNQLSWQT